MGTRRAFVSGGALLAALLGFLLLPAVADIPSALCWITGFQCRADGTADVTVTCSSDNIYTPNEAGTCGGGGTRCVVESDDWLKVYVDGREFGSQGYDCSDTRDCGYGCGCGARCSQRCTLQPTLTATVNVSGNQPHAFRADVRHIVNEFGQPRGQIVTVWNETFNPGCRSCGSCEELRDGQCYPCEALGKVCCGGICQPSCSGCQNDGDCGGNVCCGGTCCGPGQVCCPQGCVTGSSCEPPPPRGFNVVIAVWGSAGHRWQAALREPPYVRVPMSFRVWDPAAGRYVWETTADGTAPPAVPCRNRHGKELDPNIACWSRPWLVPDYDENPKGIVRTHRIHLSGPRTVYVQPECGVEFNAVLNPAKLAAAFRGPVVTFDPARGLRVDMNDADKCPVRQNVCADGRPCGRCPNGRWPERDGSCLGGGEPSGDACADGSACEAACIYTIDLTLMYEPRETPSWCYEMARDDRACQGVTQRPCPSTEANAYDDWRASSPWCWEQTLPVPQRGNPASGLGQPASFVARPNCTIDVIDGCWDPGEIARSAARCSPGGGRP